MNQQQSNTPPDSRDSTAGSPTPEQLSKEISDLAYGYYLERGGTDGFDHEDWLRAEEYVLRRHGLKE